MKYKVGDRVKAKSLDWYNENKDKDGNIPLVDHTNSKYNFTKRMRGLCGKVMTISIVHSYYYDMVEDNGEHFWTDEMIEGLVEESDDLEKMYMQSEKRYEEEYSKGEYCHEQSFKWGFQEGCDYARENEKLEINLKTGYQFVDENGNVINATKIVLEKKKKEYPKTFDKCCHIVQTAFVCDVRLHKGKYYDIFRALAKLIVCRDAYWKIAGEEMGLGKPWEPDYRYKDEYYSIYYNGFGIIQCNSFQAHVFIFPTEEMRDAFYENFKEEIEICKELL